MRFLIADDDPALGMFLARSFEAEGHSISLARDGQAAVDTFLAETPDALIADFSSGAPSATSVADLASLSQSLGYVDQQRAVIDNSINRLTASSNYASSESTQLLSTQDNLIQTDTASVATQLSSAETQQAALTQIIAALDQQGTLFQAL